MLINKALRYELKPNKKQETLLRKSCGIARFAYNWGLANRAALYNGECGHKYTNSAKQCKELNKLKKSEYKWMYDAPKSVVEVTLRDLDLAYTNFIRGMKNKEHIGRPKYKKKGIHDSFTIRNNAYMRNRSEFDIRIENNSIRLSKIGFIRSKENIPGNLGGRILNATISCDADRWYCSLCVEIEMPKIKQNNGDIVGIDLGINNFATISSGSSVIKMQSPKPLNRNIKKIKRMHRRLSSGQYNSANFNKNKVKLSKYYSRIKNIRKDYINKITSNLAKTKPVIVIEDLNIQGMKMNHRISRSIIDEGWGMFRRMLEYKTVWYGSKLIVIPAFEPTSKRCNHCGYINKNITLSDRTWVCLNCGVVNERDPNAAHNIRDKGIELLDTDSLSEFQACGVDVRPSRLMANDCEAGNEQPCQSRKTDASDVLLSEVYN
jgi:putative transposase